MSENRADNRAVLRHADLLGADLRHADLRGADLTECSYDLSTLWPEGFAPPSEDGREEVER
jgi:hypothetical protein